MYLSNPDVACDPAGLATMAPTPSISYAPAFPQSPLRQEWKEDFVCAACQTLKRTIEQDAITHVPTGKAYFYTLTGQAVSAPLVFSPGPCDFETVTRYYRMSSTGEQLRQLATICGANGHIVSEFWYNDTSGGIQIDKPASSAIVIILEGQSISENTDVGSPNTQFSIAFLNALA